MTPTDTSERALEALIVAALTGRPSAATAAQPAGAPATAPGLYPSSDDAGGAPIHDERAAYGGGWIQGRPEYYDRAHALDLVQLYAFLETTQPTIVEQLGISAEGPLRQKFLARVQGEIAKRGVVDVLRRGVKDGPAQVELFYGAARHAGAHVAGHSRRGRRARPTNSAQARQGRR